MKLSQIKNKLTGLETIAFKLPDGSFTPPHFHVTEVGSVEKNFIDCGGTVRKEEYVTFQLWEDGDFDHRLAPKKLNDIITLSEKVLGLKDHEVEVEYQGNTIGRYGLEFVEGTFVLIPKMTDCLAKEKCSISEQKEVEQTSSCSPSSGCC